MVKKNKMKKEKKRKSLIETANEGWGLKTPKQIGTSYWNLSHSKKKVKGLG